MSTKKRIADALRREADKIENGDFEKPWSKEECIEDIRNEHKAILSRYEMTYPMPGWLMDRLRFELLGETADKAKKRTEVYEKVYSMQARKAERQFIISELEQLAKTRIKNRDDYDTIKWVIGCIGEMKES